MRITGGKFSNRRLHSPTGMAIRPSSERLRQSLFNRLIHRFDVKFESSHILDLFAGTGALGLEALSHGAQSTVFVDNSRESQSLIKENIGALNIEAQTTFLPRDATRLGQNQTGRCFNLIFADPPYGNNLGDQALIELCNGRWLADDALIIVEEEKNMALNTPSQLSLIDKSRIGKADLFFLRLGAGEN